VLGSTLRVDRSQLVRDCEAILKSYLRPGAEMWVTQMSEPARKETLRRAEVWMEVGW
jgi:hypothetical protein